MGTDRAIFNVPRQQVQKWSEDDLTATIELGLKKTYVFQLYMEKEGRWWPGYSPQKWVSLAVNDFFAAKKQFERLTMNLTSSVFNEEAAKVALESKVAASMEQSPSTPIRSIPGEQQELRDRPG